MKVIVLGSKGFVGSAICAEGASRNLDITPVDLDNYEDTKGSSCDILINANGNSKKYLAKQDPVKEFELSVSSVARSLQDFRTNKYVYLSTTDVYPNVSDPKENSESAIIDEPKLSPYGLHKRLAEQLVQHYAPHWLVLRMSGFIGNGLWKNSIYDMLKGEELRVHPDSEYQYINTSDFARILFDLIEKGIENDVFNMAGAGLIKISEIAQMITGYTMPDEASENRAERYEMNIEKLSSICDIPETKNTIQSFITDVLEGKIVLK